MMMVVHLNDYLQVTRGLPVEYNNMNEVNYI